MTPAEQLKARMRLVLARADKQSSAAAAAAADNDAGAPAGAGDAGWTRFVLDKYGALDEEKQAMQQLMDEQVGQAGFAGGNSADADSEVGAAFIMGTGRAIARRAAARSAADQAHDDAIFGGGAAVAAGFGAGQQQQQRDPPIWERPEQQGKQIDKLSVGPFTSADGAAALGLGQGVLVQQGGLSWRERALAKRQQQQ
jgi:hypothetical protein